MQAREVLIRLLLIRSACAFPRPLCGLRAERRVNHRLGIGITALRFSSSALRGRGHTNELPASVSTTVTAAMSSKCTSIHWFRKGLRLHDNRALLEACDGADNLYPVFVMDSDPASPESRAGSLRYDRVEDEGWLQRRGGRTFTLS